MPIRESIVKGEVVKKVALLLFEDQDNNTGVLETQGAIVEYDILVWNDDHGVIFEKKGKTTKEKLEDTLEFDAVLGYEYSVSLDLTVVINGKRYPFLQNSPHSKVLRMITDETGLEYQYSTSFSVEEPVGDKGMTQEQWETSQNFQTFIDDYRANAGYPVEGSPEDLAIIEQAEHDAINQAYQQYRLSELELEIAMAQAEYKAGGHIDVIFYVISQSVVDMIIAKTFNNGKLPINLEDVVVDVEYMESQVKTLQKQIELAKKQSLGALFATSEETMMLDYFRNENLYNSLLNLVNAYQQTGLNNLSTYRVGVYESLKAATDNLIVLKGKLENINFVPKRKEPFKKIV